MPYAPGIDLGLLRDEADRVLVVFDLAPGIDVLARLALALAQSAVVEHQHGHARPHDRFRIVRQHDLLDVAPASAHHRDGKRRAAGIGRDQHAANLRSFAVELDVSFHALLRVKPRIWQLGSRI